MYQVFYDCFSCFFKTKKEAIQNARDFKKWAFKPKTVKVRKVRKVRKVGEKE